MAQRAGRVGAGRVSHPAAAGCGGVRYLHPRQQRREHILLSSILEAAWQQGRGLDIAQLIQEVQTPPFVRIGVFDTEAFFPAKDRHELAMKLNNFLAAPAMKVWTEGEPIDLERQLADLEAQVAQETEALRSAVDPLAEDLETLEIRPKKTDISVRLLGLGWVPFWRDERGGSLGIKSLYIR